VCVFADGPSNSKGLGGSGVGRTAGAGHDEVLHAWGKTAGAMHDEVCMLGSSTNFACLGTAPPEPSQHCIASPFMVCPNSMGVVINGSVLKDSLSGKPRKEPAGHCPEHHPQASQAVRG